MKRKIKIATLLIVSIVLGFFREFIFININEQKRVTYFHDTDSHVSSSMHWLSNLSFSTLNFAKWPLTLLFTFLFAYLSALLLKTWFGDKEKIRISWITYGLVFIAGTLIYFAGFIFGHPYETYEVSRFLAGLGQSPGLMLILLASFLVMKKN